MIVALLLLIAALNKPVEKLGIALFPIAAVMLALELNFADKTQLAVKIQLGNEHPYPDLHHCL